MCDVIKPWLSQEIQTKIRQVQDGNNGTSDISPSGAKFHFEDDGSNIRIPTKLSGKVAQLIKFTAYEEPFEVTISDKVTSITAKISSSASRRYRDLHGKPITKGTKGILIQIQKFEIVATHLGPKTSQLTLLVSDFKFIGPGGNGTWGYPQPIEMLGRVQGFLIELGRLRSKASRSDQVLLNDTQRSVDSISSQANSFDEGEPMNSQSVFATQIPSVKLLKNPRSRDDRLKRIASVSALNEAGANGTSRHSKTQGKIVASFEARYDNLYKLLSEKPILNKQSTPVGRVNIEGVKTKKLSMTRNATDIVSPKKIKSIDSDSIKPALDGSQLETDKNDETTSIRRVSNPTLSSKRLETMNASQQRLAQASVETKELFPTKGPLPYSNIQDTEFTGKPTSAPENSKMAGSKKAGIKGDDDKASILERKDDPWIGLSRISRRSVTIPKDQQTLLDRSDSWLPSQPGTRPPRGNIPVPTLQSITSQVDYDTTHSRPRQPPKKKQKTDRNSPPFSNLISACDAESESSEDSDMPISSMDWPPSSPPERPQANQLPPDSPRGESNCGNSYPTPKSVASPPIDQQCSIPKDATVTSQPGSPILHYRSGLSSSSRARLTNSQSDSSAKRDRRLEVTCPTSQYRLLGLKHDLDELHPEPRPTKRIRYDESDYKRLYACGVCGTRYKTQIELTKHGRTQCGRKQGSSDICPILDSDQSRAFEIASQEDQLLDSSGEGHEGHVSMSPVANRSRDSRIPNTVDEKETFMTSSISYREELLSAAEACSQSPGTLRVQTKSSPRADVQECEHQYPCTADFGKKSVLQVNRTPYSVGQTVQPFSVVGKANVVMDERPLRSSKDHLYSDDVIPGTYSDMTFSDDTVNIRKDVDAQHVMQTELRDERKADREPLLSVDNTSHNVESLVDVAFELVNKRPEEILSTSSPPESSDLDNKVEINGKRKVNETDSGVQNVAKRQKRLKVSKDFNFSQGTRISEDPKILAREQRREFFLHHKNGGPDHCNEEDSARKHSEPSQPDQQTYASSYLLRTAFETDVNALEPVSSHNTSGIPAGRVGSVANTIESHAADANVAIHLGEYEIKSQAPIREPSKAVTKSGEEPHPQDNTTTVSQRSVFERFQEAYDVYKGNEKHFITMCHKIDILLKGNRMAHRSLWDDFIIRHHIEYRRYLLQCADQADDPIPYEQFYLDEIEEPASTKKIITPAILGEVISSIKPHDSTRANSPTSLLNLGPDHQHVPSTPSVHRSSTPRPIKPSTIDLTSDKEASSLPLCAPSKKSPRRLPWVHPHSSPSRSSKPNLQPASSHPEPSPSKNPTHLNPLANSHIKLKPPISPQTRSSISKPRSSVIRWLDETSPTSSSPSKSADNQRPQFAKPDDSNKAPTQVAISSSDNPSRGTIKHSPTTAPTANLPSKWYLDPSSPFNVYARLDASIRSGNGNSWAGTNALGVADSVTEGGGHRAGRVETVVPARRRRPNILEWEV